LAGNQGTATGEALSILGKVTVREGGKNAMGTMFNVTGKTVAGVGDLSEALGHLAAIVPGGQGAGGVMTGTGGTAGLVGEGISHIGDLIKGDFDRTDFAVDAAFEGVGLGLDEGINALKLTGQEKTILQSLSGLWQSGTKPAVQVIVNQIQRKETKEKEEEND
jgi:hypothetical protein